MKNFYQKGITLGEILLAIAIMAILAVIVLPGFMKIKKIQVLTGATEDIISVIGKARSQTLSSLNSSSYGVHFGNNSVIIFIDNGNPFDPDDPDNQITNLVSPATISSINLSDASSEISFSRLSGLPSTTGTVTVSVPGVSSKTITISTVGSASIN